MARIIVGISGASGIVLGYRTINVLSQLGHDVELVMTRDAGLTAVEEMGKDFSTPEKMVGSLSAEQQQKICVHKIQDFSASIASGSYPVDGMIIVPCSMATLAAISYGLADNLLRRAADVTLKERRRLVIVPREAPLSEIHLENMLRLTRMGSIIVPPMPAWYTHPSSMEDVENFIVGRSLDALRIDSEIYPRWKV
jgi:4-hydroxy-3-polyprenylbenzoate decarboxylase